MSFSLFSNFVSSNELPLAVAIIAATVNRAAGPGICAATGIITYIAAQAIRYFAEEIDVENTKIEYDPNEPVDNLSPEQRMAMKRASRFWDSLRTETSST